MSWGAPEGDGGGGCSEQPSLCTSILYRTVLGVSLVLCWFVCASHLVRGLGEKYLGTGSAKHHPVPL